VKAEGRQQVLVEPDEGRVVTWRVAAGRDRREEEKRGPKVVEQDEQDRG